LLLCLIAAVAPAAAGEPLAVAHRGLLLHAPENTLANIRACLELRLGFECDVQRTKDGHLVCIHDETVDRTTNGSGRVAELTLDEIRQLDAGSWFHPRFAGEKVPTIDEILTLLAESHQPGVLVAIDLKADRVAGEVVRLAQQHKVLDQLLFIGTAISQPAVRTQIRQASAQAHAAAVANNTGEFQNSLAASDADWVYFRYLPPADQLKQVQSAGKRSFIAGKTVGDRLPGNWRQATRAGLDAILTNHPLELRMMLRQDAERKPGDG